MSKPTTEMLSAMVEAINAQSRFNAYYAGCTADASGRARFEKESAMWLWLAENLPDLIAAHGLMAWCESNAVGVVTRDANGEETTHRQELGRADESFAAWLAQTATLADSRAEADRVLDNDVAAPTEVAVSADDVRAVASMLRAGIAKALARKTGVTLSLEDAQGYALVLESAADRIATLLRYAESPAPSHMPDKPDGAETPTRDATT